MGSLFLHLRFGAMLSRYTLPHLHLDALAVIYRRMATLPKVEETWSYQESVSHLNALQSNATAVQKIKERVRRRESCVNLTETWKYLNRIGVTQDDLKKLSVVHIAGTKGKGTTSAMCESILRHHGYRTGLYTSPHLVSVTERFQIEGKQLTKDSFSSHFSRVFKSLHNQQDYDGDMPGYFMFLTVLAFDVFLREKVDVAVVEVGIGGEYDITNVVNNVVAAGITSLGLEHTAILGNTIEQIAREKGGIMKNGCVAFTVHQPLSAMNVLMNIALTRNCALSVVPDFDLYIWESDKVPKLKADIFPFRMNTSLAIQLAHTWISHHSKSIENDKNIFTNLRQYLETECNTNKAALSNDAQSSNIEGNDNGNLIKQFVNKHKCVMNIPVKTSEAVSSCVWPGRCQILKDTFVDYYIDGAHTIESVELCVTWFLKHRSSSANKILIFNITGDRNSQPMLKLLADVNFDAAIFTPNIAYRNKECVDQINYSNCEENVIATCKKNLEIWNDLHKERNSSARIMNCVEDAVDYVNATFTEKSERPQILVTGSLHLVGALLAVLTAL